MLLVAVSLVTAGPPSVTPAPGPATGIVHMVGAAAQQSARGFWTPARMAAAVAGSEKGATGQAAAGTAGPPAGTPTADPFGGVPTVGALFYTTGSVGHFCTASVVDSTYGDLVVTAAHCVYANGYATNIEFVPDYHDGVRPHGAWLVQAVVVATAWRQSHDPDLDIAFVIVVAAGHPGWKIQRATGGLRFGAGLGYGRWTGLIGYNNAVEDPVWCAAHSHEFRRGQMVFYCHGYRDGTSGGPWIIGLTSRGTGTLYGVIGGYQQGGSYEWASYSPALGAAALALYRQAEATAARR
jgi:Trypsin